MAKSRNPYCTGCGVIFDQMHLMINHRRIDRCGGRFLPLEERYLWGTIAQCDRIVKTTDSETILSSVRSKSYKAAVRVTLMRKKRLSESTPDVGHPKLPAYYRQTQAASKDQEKKANKARIGYANKPKATGVRFEGERKVFLAQQRLHSAKARRRRRRADRYFNSHRRWL